VPTSAEGFAAPEGPPIEDIFAAIRVES